MAPECQHEGRPQKVAAHCCNCSVTGISNTGCAKWGMTIAHQLCCHLPASKTAYVCNKWQPSIVPFCKVEQFCIDLFVITLQQPYQQKRDFGGGVWYFWTTKEKLLFLEMPHPTRCLCS